MAHVTPSDRTPAHWANQLWHSWQSAQTTLTETITDASQALSQTTDQARLSFATSRDRALQTLADTTQQAMTIASSQTTQAVDTADRFRHQAMAGITGTAEHAKASMTRLPSLGSFSDSVASSLQNNITNTVQGWLNAHPVVGWFVSHPLITALLVLLLIWLGWGLLRAIAQLSERVWLGIFRFPFRLGQWLMQVIFRTKQPAAPSAPKYELLQSNPQTKQEKLTTLLARLEALRREQDELIKEVQAILTLEDQR